MEYVKPNDIDQVCYYDYFNKSLYKKLYSPKPPYNLYSLLYFKYI